MQDKLHNTKIRSVVMLAFPGAQVLDITGPMEIFKGANDVLARHELSDMPVYKLALATHEGGLFETTSGIRLYADCNLSALTQSIDTLLVSGGDGVREALHDKELIAFIQRASKKARRVASVCSGAFLLAQAGLLDGRRAAAHWRICDLLAKNFPKVTVDRDALYVRDGKFSSSAGVTAGMDLSLALVAEDCGHRVALEVARDKVLFMIRSGGQSQFSTHLLAESTESDRLRSGMTWALENLQARLTVEDLATRAAMSTRNFARVFCQQTGATPAHFIERARIDAARRKLEDSNKAVDVVATECGFGNGERMRRAFHRHIGIAPNVYRERFQTP
ncbi:MAG: GlxA family transcriptional regulator [Alphaproteobacteria bacterium]|nr:GlxA family transcriptional regulator [Alphaproteobacteria bacterium]